MAWNRSPDVKGLAWKERKEKRENERTTDACTTAATKCLWRSRISRRLFRDRGLIKMHDTPADTKRVDSSGEQAPA